MAKTQEALLSEVVSLLRKQNQLSTRDRLRESEEAKRQEKLTETTTDTQATTGMMIDSATDFQRRYLAGQAKTITDRMSGNAPTGSRQETIEGHLDNMRGVLYSEDGHLKNIWFRLGTILSVQQETLRLFYRGFKLDQQEFVNEKRWRLNQMRSANEARLENINPQLAMAGAGGVGGTLALPEPEEGGGSGFGNAFGASALTVAALAVMKKLKTAFKFVFGLPKRIGLALRLAGVTIFSKFLKTAKGKPFLKNVGRIRAWPIILAAMVANSFYSGITSAFADDQTGGNPHQDSATAEDQSMLDKVLGNNILNTGLNVWLGWSVANWLTKGKLGAGLALFAKKAWHVSKAGVLGKFLLRALAAAGGAAVGLSAPVWGSILAAGLIAYHWDAISGALKNSWDLNFGAIGTASTPGGMELELASKITDPIKAGDFPVFNPEGPGGATLIAGQDQQLTEMFRRIKLGGNAEIASKMLYDGLIQAGHNPARIKKLARAAGLSFAWTKPGAHHAGMPIPDFAAYEARKQAELQSKLLANNSSMQGSFATKTSNLSSLLDRKGGTPSSIIAPYLSQSGRLLDQEMQASRERFNARLAGDGIFTNNAMGTAPVTVVAPQDNSQQNVEIKNYNLYEPSWGGATTEAYERHTSFGGNGAGNWF